MADELLVLDSVGLSFRRGRRQWWVLRDVSLVVGQREVVGVFGSRGSGKSTLLEVAAGMLSPDEGRVFFEGQDLASLSASARAALLGDGIAWLDRAGLEEFSVLQYVAMAKKLGHGFGKRQAEDLAMEALERVGIAACADQTWGRISNWERVLAAFARGFVAKPRLMVIEDLLDWLREGGMREAGELLLSLAGELRCGVLIVSADPEALMIADRVLTLDEGTITPKHTNIVHLLRWHGGQARHGHG